MAASTPDLDVATALENAGHGTKGTNLFIGHERAPSSTIPEAAIFCRASGGPSPSRFFGDTESFYQKAVQIIIRGANENDTATTRTLARAIMTTLQSSTVAGYVTSFVLESEPNYLGLDDQEQPRFTLNVRLWKKED